MPAGNFRILAKEDRLEVIKQMLPAGSTYKEIAKKCFCSVQTIKFDVIAWRKSGGLREWLTVEFYELYDAIKADNPELAFKMVVRLMENERKLETKRQIQTNVKIEHVVGKEVADLARDLWRVERDEEPKQVEVDYNVIDSDTDPELMKGSNTESLDTKAEAVR